MRCFNVRQLKNNPSEALRSAVDGPVLVLKGDLPEALLLHLQLQDSPDGADVKLALAVALFKAGSLSLGRAARVASVPVPQLIRHLSRLGLSIANGTAEETRQDLDSLDAWLASS